MLQGHRAALSIPHILLFHLLQVQLLSIARVVHESELGVLFKPHVYPAF